MGNLSRIVFFVQILLPAAFVAQSYAQSPGGDPKAQGKPRHSQGPLEIGPFGRVITCDPGRRDGTRISRLVEFSVGELFLENEILPDGQGFYQVPATAGRRCIGLSWSEKRPLRRLELHFKKRDDVPDPDKTKVEYWSSENQDNDDISVNAGSSRSCWQGLWRPLPGKKHKDRNRLVYLIDVKQVPEFVKGSGTHKIRWIFPAAAGPCPVKQLSAQSSNVAGVGRFRVELEQPRPGEQATLEMYNGYWADAKSSETALTRKWDLGKPLSVDVRYTLLPKQADRTLVRFTMPRADLPAAGFSVALEDVLTSGGVYVRDFGVFVASESSKRTLAQYKRAIKGRQTTLEKVRRMPDQTYAQAKKVLLDPRCNRDPMMLSLACGNSKFIVQRSGNLGWPVSIGAGAIYKNEAEIQPRFGSGSTEKLERHLEDRWFPIPVITCQDRGIVYRQRSFVAPFDKETSSGQPAWLNHKPLCVVEYVVENPGQKAAEVSLSLNLLGVDSLQEIEGGVVARRKTEPRAQLWWRKDKPEGPATSKTNVLYAFIDRSGCKGLRQTIKGSRIEYRGRIAPGEKACCVAFVPGWTINPEEYRTLTGDVETLAARAKDQWRRIFATAMQIETPEEELNDLIRALQVNCLLLFRNQRNGVLIEPSAGASLGPIDTEAQNPVGGLDLLGHGDIARRCLDYFLSRYSEKGYLADNYAILGTGQNLWTLGQHYMLTREKAWLKSIAPQLMKSCRWINQQREKTRRLRPDGDKLPEWGLFTPGTLADWERYAYYFYANAFYYAGLRATADVLADLHQPGADALLKEAENYRRDILRAYRWNQARMPVLPLADGTWVPAYPSSLYCFGRTADFYKGMSAVGHDVEVGGNHLLNLGVLDPDSPDARWINDFMEDDWFMQSVWSEFPVDKIKKNWFTYGGFSKLQPWYTRNGEISALRDDVKPFIRTYFNTLFTSLSAETLAFWENFAGGDWDKACEIGNFLRLTRMMYIMERGEELWLAPFVTNQWMQDGMRVKIRNAPTNFGPVSYQIDSHLKEGYIQAEIDPPTRNAMKALVIRLRHPEEKKMRRVTVNGQETQDFKPEREIIRLKPGSGRITIRAFY